MKLRQRKKLGRKSLVNLMKRIAREMRIENFPEFTPAWKISFGMSAIQAGQRLMKLSDRQLVRCYFATTIPIDVASGCNVGGWFYDTKKEVIAFLQGVRVDELNKREDLYQQLCKVYNDKVRATKKKTTLVVDFYTGQLVPKVVPIDF